MGSDWKLELGTLAGLAALMAFVAWVCLALAGMTA